MVSVFIALVKRISHKGCYLYEFTLILLMPRYMIQSKANTTVHYKKAMVKQ